MSRLARLWGTLAPSPTTLAQVSGLSREQILQAGRDALVKLRFPHAKWHDAPLQWGDALQARGSAWAAWLLVRGSLAWHVVSDEAAHLVPWVRERVGQQELILCARSTGPTTCEVVISVRQANQGTNQTTFAEQALAAVLPHLEEAGGRIDSVQPVPATQLPTDCPAHLTTRALLAREARQLKKTKGRP